MHALSKVGFFAFNQKLCLCFVYARQYEQTLLHSLARKLAAARHSPSKLGLCARLAQTFPSAQTVFAACAVFLLPRSYFFLAPSNFSLSAQIIFITKFVTSVTNFVIRIRNFVTCITNFVIKIILAERKKYHGLRKKFPLDSKKYKGDNIGGIGR